MPKKRSPQDLTTRDRQASKKRHDKLKADHKQLKAELETFRSQTEFWLGRLRKKVFK